jgi:hypothetical protein
MIEESRVLELMCQVKNFTVDYETNTNHRAVYVTKPRS